jgi:hypothetical protein
MHYCWTQILAFLLQIMWKSTYIYSNSFLRVGLYKEYTSKMFSESKLLSKSLPDVQSCSFPFSFTHWVFKMLAVSWTANKSSCFYLYFFNHWWTSFHLFARSSFCILAIHMLNYLWPYHPECPWSHDMFKY